MASLLDALRRDVAEMGFEIPTASEINAVVGALLRRVEHAALHPLLSAPPDTAPDVAATIHAHPDGSPLAVPSVIAPLPTPAPAPQIIAPPMPTSSTPPAPAAGEPDPADLLAQALDTNTALRAQIAEMQAAFIPAAPTVNVTGTLPADLGAQNTGGG